MIRTGLAILVFSVSVLFSQIKNVDLSTAKYPLTINQAVDSLMVIVSADNKAQIKAMKKKDLIQLHFEFGMWIRNNFGLWAGNRSLLNECGDSLKQTRIHPDDASMLIIKKFWDKLQSSSLNNNDPEQENRDTIRVDKKKIRD